MDLTIIIPTYNRNQTVAECVLALQHNEAEIIVVDDGSSEPVEFPGHIRVLRHDRNRGRAAALNTGLKAAAHDLVLIVDDDMFASPDMVVRLVDEYALRQNSKLALVGRVVWDPDLPLTMTMQWLEKEGPFSAVYSGAGGSLENLWTGNTLLWRPFIMEHGGFDEHFTRHGLDDVELGLRLKPHGMEIQIHPLAVAYHHKFMRVRDFVHREEDRGADAVYLYSKFPQNVPQVDNPEALLQNEALWPEAEAALEELALLEQSGSKKIPSGAPALFVALHRYHFMHGMLEALRDMGGVRQRAQSTQTLALYNLASRLESMREFEEARRLFQLVRSRKDQEYWAGAEYHLGCIEEQLGDMRAAEAHLTECLTLNPGHRKARQFLHKQDAYIEVQPNVYERVKAGATPKVLFVLFGGLGDVLHAIPVVTALRAKFEPAELVWMTLSKYASLARAAAADSVCEVEQRAVLPWKWIEGEGFTHVFYPETRANQEEWQQSGMHAIDFLAYKCGVQLQQRRVRLEPGPEAFREAEEFLQQHNLERKEFLSAAHVSVSSRHWPHSKLTRLSQSSEMPLVIFGGADDPVIPGSIPCFAKSFQTVAALIELSAFYVGSDSGVSWLATTTNTPMGVFLDPARQKQVKTGYRDVLRGEKDDIEEWGIHTGADVVLDRMDRVTPCHV